MLQEFKDFVNKGNFVEIAVAFVIGAAFGRVVNVFTTRVVTPFIGLLFDVPDLDALLTFGKIDPETGVPAGSFGAFLGAFLDFLIVAFVMFLVVRAYNRFKEASAEPQPEPEPEAEPEEVVLLRQIRDALASR